jgi:hypothetical protein
LKRNTIFYALKFNKDMSTTTLQPKRITSRHYQIIDKELQNSEKIPPNREKTLRDIEVWSAYLRDLKAGKPIENPSPSNDPYFLISENIEGIIRSLKDKLQGKGRAIDPDNIWECIK